MHTLPSANIDISIRRNVAEDPIQRMTDTELNCDFYYLRGQGGGVREW